jgi:hypothetical protein
LTSAEALKTKPGHLGENDLGAAKFGSPLGEAKIEHAEMPTKAPQIISTLKRPASPWKEEEIL